MPANNDRGVDDFPKALTSWQWGQLSFQDDLAMPFLRESIGALIDDGFSEEPQIPLGLIDDHKSTPSAFFGVDDAVIGIAVIGIAVFVGTSIGTWAVGRICDSIWDQKIGPALRKLFRRRKSEKGFGQRPLIFSFGARFEPDNVFVQVIATLRQGESAEGIDKLVPEAFRRALTWIDQHGVQQPVLVYRIQSGELSSLPTLANTVPRA